MCLIYKAGISLFERQQERAFPAIHCSTSRKRDLALRLGSLIPAYAVFNAQHHDAISAS